MTDVTQEPTVAETTVQRIRKAPKAEFMTYFALIFVATLPLSLFTWVLGVLRTGSLNRQNPVSAAWSQARIITPMIFAA